MQNPAGLSLSKVMGSFLNFKDETQIQGLKGLVGFEWVNEGFIRQVQCWILDHDFTRRLNRQVYEHECLNMIVKNLISVLTFPSYIQHEERIKELIQWALAFAHTAS